MLVFSEHLNDIRNYMKKFNDVDPLGTEVISFLERVKGTPQVHNVRRGKLRDGG
ncbi:MAG: hypothetical protein MPF33_10860 [Candidatus Aramenus sp.]|nr:hypothetical protein [Candidatus Aramenus sp.]